MNKIICAALLCSILSGSTIAATPTLIQKKEKPLEQMPMECEAVMARLDFAVIETKKLEDAYLIIVARLGTGEASRLNQIRLAGAEEYVLRRGTDLKYMLAVAKRVNGLGRLEVYVGGRLKEIMPFEKNAKGYCIHEGS